MRCLSCDEWLDRRKMRRERDDSSVVHQWAGTCKCGEPVTMSVRAPSKPVVAKQPDLQIGTNFVARPRFGDRRRVVL